MQMIAWGWRNERDSQRHWAKRLKTTTNGTSVYDIARVVDRRTGWDGREHAGPYIVLDIGKYSYATWMLLMMRHIHDYKAPVVLHPILLKRFYPYLDDDASGHFQVGGLREARQEDRRARLLRAVEPAAVRSVRAPNRPGPMA